MKKQIHTAFDEIKAEQQLKTDTKYFLYEFYNKKETAQLKPLNKFILASLSAVLVVVLSFGVFATAVPVSAVSFDVENTSVELELNSLNKVVSVNCFGEESGFSQLELKNLDCEKAVLLIVEKARSENTDISSATLTVNCRNAEKAEKIADSFSDEAITDISITCHSTHSKLRDEAHAHGISMGKYQAYLILKEYEPELDIEEISSITTKELKEKINGHTCGKDTETSTQSHKNIHGNHTGTSVAGNGEHHGQNK